MKKLMLVALTVAAFGITSCGSDDDGGVDCVSLATNVANAAETYGADQSVANCEAYKAALEAYANSGCEGSGDVGALISALDCTTGN